jgi:hypothetical protein
MEGFSSWDFVINLSESDFPIKWVYFPSSSVLLLISFVKCTITIGRTTQSWLWFFPLFVIHLDSQSASHFHMTFELQISRKTWIIFVGKSRQEFREISWSRHAQVHHKAGTRSQLRSMWWSHVETWKEESSFRNSLRWRKWLDSTLEWLCIISHFC